MIENYEDHDNYTSKVEKTVFLIVIIKYKPIILKDINSILFKWQFK